MIISPLNYPGNKAKVVKQIIDVLPRNLDFFVDVFCGSGIVAVNSPAKNVICNDKSAHSIELLSYFYRTPTELILKNIADIIEKYGLTNSRLEPIGTYKEIRHEGLSVHNKKGFIKMKDDYNSNKSVDLLFALVIFGFNHYLRFNSRNEFNVPVGKVDFSKSLYQKTVDFCEQLKKKNVELLNSDFRNPALYNHTSEVLYYFDPPYLITNAPYNDSWNSQDENDLFILLDSLNSRGLKFALSNVFVSNGKTNDKLIEWSSKYKIIDLKRQYRNANYRRKNLSDAQEVLIINF